MPAVVRTAIFLAEQAGSKNNPSRRSGAVFISGNGPNGFPLDLYDFFDSSPGQAQERREFFLAERLLLRSALDFHDPALVAQDHVDVAVGLAVLFIIEIERRFALEDSNAHRAHVAFKR